MLETRRRVKRAPCLLRSEQRIVSLASLELAELKATSAGYFRTILPPPLPLSLAYSFGRIDELDPFASQLCSCIQIRRGQGEDGGRKTGEREVSQRRGSFFLFRVRKTSRSLTVFSCRRFAVTWIASNRISPAFTFLTLSPRKSWEGGAKGDRDGRLLGHY